mmetsp:Transcript_25929/g.38308  ORF Transcript_25929/g.38308 Transcript_25929/m.38308 type:complete len:240 (+) Transcript_25929:169-888(+)
MQRLFRKKQKQQQEVAENNKQPVIQYDDAIPIVTEVEILPATAPPSYHASSFQQQPLPPTATPVAAAAQNPVDLWEQQPPPSPSPPQYSATASNTIIPPAHNCSMTNNSSNASAPQWTAFQQSGTSDVYNHNDANMVDQEGGVEIQLKSMKKKRKTQTVVAGLVGGTIGLLTLGPPGAIIFGYGSAVGTKEFGKQKERRVKRKAEEHRRMQEEQQQRQMQQQQQQAPKQGRWRKLFQRQ